MFLLIIFLILITYISSFAYENKYYPITLSKFQYSTYKTHQDLPEDIDSITYAANLDQCPQGQCAIDRQTGFKRCPEKVTNRLVYNRQEEACTRVNFCDYEPLPYAVSTDGSAVSKVCENNPDGEKIPCRCTDQQKCSQNELVKFSIVGGDPSNTSSENFAIIQSDVVDQSKIGYYNIPIRDTSTDFCKINPGFTDILVNGCDFQNSIQDRLGCRFISSVTLNSANNLPLKWEIRKNITKNDQVMYLQVEITETQNIYLSPSGMLILTATPSGSKVTEIIKYSNITPNPPKPAPQPSAAEYKVVSLSNIVSIYLEEGSTVEPVTGTTGFQYPWPAAWPPPGTDTPSISLADLDVSNCVTPNTEPNYKNMLMCTQSDNSLCKYGTFSYNFDKLRNIKDKEINVTDETFSRNFCQFNVNKDPNVVQKNFIQDPTFYTLSCSLGSGCDGKSFNLPDVSGDNVKNINSQSAGKYFPEVDINGINGIWDVSTNKFPNLILDDSKYLLNNDTIQAGDFWSIKFFNQTLISGNKGTSSGGSSIIVQDLFGLSQYVNTKIPDIDILAPGLCIGTNTTGYRLTAANYTVDDNGDNVSGICFTPSLTEAIPAFAPIKVKPPNSLKDYTYGIIAKDKLQSSKNPYVLKQLDGTSIPADIFQNNSIEVHLVIYKQFSFSGANYVTKIIKDPSGKGFNRRVYINGSNNPYTSPATKEYLKPPQDTSQLDLTLYNVFGDNTAFYSPEAPFKIPMSMYYPVWNPVLFQQECVRCKPSLISYPQLTSEGRISNIIIQFCGKDFGNYEYNATNNTYCYVSTSELNFNNPEKADITSQRLILKEPNPNVVVGDYVLDCSLQLPHNVIASNPKIDNTQIYSSLKILPQIFPSQTSITDYKNVFQEIYDGEFPISFGAEESTSENFSFNNEKLYPSKGVSVIYNKKTSSWQTTISAGEGSCYFFGKKYQDAYKYNTQMTPGTNGVYTDGFYFVPVQKVTNISSDKRIFILDSPYPYKIKQIQNRTTHIQFCRLDSSLGLCVTSSGGQLYPNTVLSVDSLCDSRITRIKIDKNGDTFVLENPPVISVETKNQNFV